MDGSALSVIIYFRQSSLTSQSIPIEIQLSESITDPLLLQKSITCDEVQTLILAQLECQTFLSF